MEDVIAKTRQAAALFDGSLEIGNHDSITLFGATAQMNLRDYSRSVSRIFISQNDELNNAIDNAVAEIEKFEAKSQSKVVSILGARNLNRHIANKYSKVAEYIEQVSLFFQLQHAQLLKEIKLLEKLEFSVQENVTVLADCIKVGTTILSQKEVLKQKAMADHPPDILCNDKVNDMWYSRLERRIDDLRISHTVALQCQTQIKLLRENDMILLDRLSSAIANTFPLWESQMATIVGVEALQMHLRNQEKVIESMTGSHEKLRKMNSPQLKRRIDVASILDANRKLKSSLQETASLEMKDTNLRGGFRKIAESMERG